MPVPILMPTTIRPATQSDIPYLHHHWNESGWEISLEDAAKQLERTDFFQFLQEQGGTYEDYIEYRLTNPMGGNK